MSIDFPDDWGDDYAEAARIERHRRDERPDPNTGTYEPEDEADERT